MPNILQYDTPNLGLQPSEIGVEATARAAQRLSLYGSQKAQDLSATGQIIGRAIDTAGDIAVQMETHQQISKGALVGTHVLGNLDQEWNNIINGTPDPNNPGKFITPPADPTDPTIKQKFLDEQVESQLDNFKDGFTTTESQKYADEVADHIRQHFFTKTSADMSTMAGIASHQNAIGAINLGANTVFNDPSTLQAQLALTKHAVDATFASSPNISAEDHIRYGSQVWDEAQHKLVTAAVQGTIMKGGDWRSVANDPNNAPYVSAAENEQFARAEHTYQRMNDAAAKTDAANQRETARIDFNGKMNDLELATIPQQAGAQPMLPTDYWDKLKQYGAMPGAAMEPGRLRTMIENGETLTNRLGKPEPLAGVSHQSTMELLNGMRDGSITDTSPIYKAYSDGKLNNSDFKFAMDNFSQAQTPEGARLDKDRDLFFKRYQFQIDPEAGMGNDMRSPMYEAEMAARGQEMDLRKRGLDPHLLYDPTSEYFFGSPANIMKYRQPLQQQLRQPATAAAPASTQPARPKIPPLVKQNGHTYQLQGDGSYKAID